MSNNTVSVITTRSSEMKYLFNELAVLGLTVKYRTNIITVNENLRELLIGETTQYLHCHRRSNSLFDILCAVEVTLFH